MKDKAGNILNVDRIGGVHLRLIKENNKVRPIGTLIRRNTATKKGLLIYKKYENSLFRKLKAFGFCHKIIKLNPDRIHVIWIGGSEVKRGRYSIGIKKFKKEAIILNFKKKGIELRSYVPIDRFKFKEE